MAFEILTAAPLPPQTYITTTEGGSGYFAVQIWWNPDMGGFWEPWDTGIGRYATLGEAAAEARDWAEAEGRPYLPPRTEQS